MGASLQHKFSLCVLAGGLGLLSMGPLGPCACRTPLEPGLAPTPIPPTPTPAPVATKVVYDGESPATVVCGSCFWVAPAAGLPRTTMAAGAGYAHSGVQGLRLQFAWPDPAWYGGFGYNWGGWSQPAQAVNTLPYDTLEFWVRGLAGGEQGLNVLLADTASAATGSLTLVPGYLVALTTGWQHVSIPLGDFSWGSVDRGRVWEIQIATGYANTGSAGIDIDEVRFAKY